MKWFEQKEVLSYIIDSYAGVDGYKRQFIWEEKSGDVVIGNTRAFTDHLSERFDLHKTSKAWTDVHTALRALGEIVHPYTPRTRVLGKRFKNQEPEVRILRRKDRTQSELPELPELL